MEQFQAGSYLQQPYHKTFQPSPIHRKWLLSDMGLIQLLELADRELGRLDFYSSHIPNIDLFISMHVTKEATQSSKIEGTQTNMQEAFLEKDDLIPEKRQDWEEVRNYVSAMNEAIQQLHKLPFSSRLIRETHRILMKGVRGEKKQPGEFRTSQNWIGGATINDAVFIPPAHTSIPALMSDLEKFAHDEVNYFPDLLKIALIHYQFETIHPFLDGNGRVGRLMIILYLVSKDILKKPVLYLSDFFEKNRTLYYDNLMRVREQNDLQQWFRFFLVGMIETSKKSIDTFDKIFDLKKKTDAIITRMGSKAGKAEKLMDYLYHRPMIDAEKVRSVTGSSAATAYSLIREFEKNGILKEVTGGQRGRIYSFEKYLKLFK